ncbi:hypothetical protein I5E68_09860 [Novosphingobium sp. YJ-S2-02]|uniref:Uncharacterized protein n=1 Tax=Novosphingobium aureum TaxID=2792964 RepID=A0A931HC04_9SPHN|nr:hypothetical protein [Novosphingobium aureum]MBH0113250.1 hypothetical protein [Novosphingobium aureum]
MLAALAARFGLSLLMSRLRMIVGRVPASLWIVLAVVLIGTAGVILHRREVAAHYKTAYEAGRTAERALWERRLADARDEGERWRSDYEAAAAKLTTQIGENHALETRLAAALADDLRVQGPGRAGVCPGPAAAAGGSRTADGPADAPLAPLPPEQPLAIVPWGDLVRYAEQADLARAEAVTWRTWYLANVEALRKARLDAPSPLFGNEK